MFLVFFINTSWLQACTLIWTNKHYTWCVSLFFGYKNTNSIVVALSYMCNLLVWSYNIFPQDLKRSLNRKHSEWRRTCKGTTHCHKKHHQLKKMQTIQSEQPVTATYKKTLYFPQTVAECFQIECKCWC